MQDDYYLVQFDHVEDYKFALYEGPWRVANHYIIVQHWRLLFLKNAEVTKKVEA